MVVGDTAMRCGTVGLSPISNENIIRLKSILTFICWISVRLCICQTGWKMVKHTKIAGI